MSNLYIRTYPILCSHSQYIISDLCKRNALGGATKEESWTRPRGSTPRFRKRIKEWEWRRETNRYGRSRTNINYARSNSKLGSGQVERQDITAEGLRGARISWKVLAEYAPRTRVILHNSWANQCTQMPIDIPSTHDHRGGGGSGDSKKRERERRRQRPWSPAPYVIRDSYCLA